MSSAFIETILGKLGVDHRTLAEDEAVARCADLEARFGEREHRNEPVQLSADVGELSGDEVRGWLGELPVDPGLVLALWPANRHGVELAWADFCREYDEIWLPAATDVWVAPASLTWLLELDPDELFWFWKGHE